MSETTDNEDYLEYTAPPSNQQFAAIEVTTIQDIVQESKEGYFVQRFFKNFFDQDLPQMDMIEQFNLKAAKSKNLYQTAEQFITDLFKHFREIDFAMKYENYVNSNFVQLNSEYNKLTDNKSNVVAFKIYQVFPTNELATKFLEDMKSEEKAKNTQLNVAPMGYHIPLDKRYLQYAENSVELLDDLNEMKKRERKQQTYKTIEFAARKEESKRDMINIFNRMNKKNQAEREENIKINNKRSSVDEIAEEEMINMLKKQAGFDINKDERYKNTRSVADQLYWEEKDDERLKLSAYTELLHKKYQDQRKKDEDEYLKQNNNDHSNVYEKYENNEYDSI